MPNDGHCQGAQDRAGVGVSGGGGHRLKKPLEACFEGLRQLPLSAVLTALAALLAGLVATIGILALLTGGVLATLLAAPTLVLLASLPPC
jgi:hypothetical protein